MPNISFTVKHDLCTGCGICEGACPTHSIRIKAVKGKFVPSVDEQACIHSKGCHRCYDCCPGLNISLSKIANQKFVGSGVKQDIRIGRYIGCFTGCSNDYEIRYHGASGGMVSQLLIWLLEKKYIDGAVVTSFDPQNELLVRTSIATTKEEILAAKSSKYAPVTFNRVIQDIKKQEGKFIIVGLPCHIHGFRKYEEMDKQFKEKILGYFGLYCSYNNTFYLTDYVFLRKEINKKDLTYFAYRDEGCLGSMVAKGNKGGHPFIIKDHYQNYYNPLRSFFKPRRCLLCIDHFAELADVSFGDIHIKPYSSDKIGINSLVVRNPQFLTWINEAACEDIITLNPLDKETLIQSQGVIYQKKQRSATFMKMDRLFGRKVPQYDTVLKDNSPLKSIISYLHTMVQLFIGKHKKLWFIVDKLKKKTTID